MFHKPSVSVRATTLRQTGIGKAAVALMLLLWLGLFVTASSPALHGLLHKHSQSAAHQCVITQLQQHLIFAGLENMAVPVPVLAVIDFTPLAAIQVFSSRDYLLSPSRAPPSVQFCFHA
jgi:hypothetical protein